MSGDIEKNSEIDQIMKWANQMTSKNSKDAVKFEYRDDGVYILVSQPSGESPVDPDEVVRDIEARKIQNPDYSIVRQVAREMKGELVRIAPPQQQVSEVAIINVEVGNSKMEAYLKIAPARGGQPVTKEDIANALQEKGVIYGIREDIIERAVDMQSVTEPLTIAHGVNPIDGENSKIEYKFGSDVLRGKPTELVDGRVDYYNLNMIRNVEQGEVLAVKQSLSLGTPGFTVTGQEIPAKPGKDVQIAIGKNVELRENNTLAISTTKGHAVLAGNKLSVSNVYEINGDVDFNTGNIEFNGTVVIKGSIREGFKVVADGDVEVMNTIADGVVECTGLLRVRNGIVGSKSRIKAGGSVFTKFIENSIVDSGGEVVVGEAIMHSKVSAKKSVIVGGKGVIVGGIVRAAEEINCKIVGSPLATLTELEAGINPELRLEYAQIIKLKQAKDLDYEKADKAVKLLNYLKETQGELPQDKLAVLMRVSRLQAQLTEEIEELRQNAENAEFQIQQSERGKVMVQGVIHSGVKVTIGSAFMHTHDDYNFACLIKVGEEIKVSSYR